MTHIIAVLSNIPRLSYHIRALLPNITVSNILPETKETLEVLEKAEILVADCDLLVSYIDKLPSVKWVQSTWAGIDKLVSHVQNKDINFIITRFSNRHFGAAMSEYVIAQIVNFERNQRQQYENQKNLIWSREGKIFNHRLVSDLTIGILGVGSIGKAIAETLKAHGATVWGMSRNVPKERLNCLDEHKTTEFLSDILKNCDYIVNVLPTTPFTKGLLNGDMLKSCKSEGSVFINIGRGTIIKEDDLINALRRGWISGAILDVFETEPLPESSKLWSLPQVTISPHISGVTRSQDVADFFVENYTRYIKGEAMLNIFNWDQGY